MLAYCYYAVVIGRSPGIYTNWSTYIDQVWGYSGAISQGFPTKSAAVTFLITGKRVLTNGTLQMSINSSHLNELTPRVNVYADGACGRYGSSDFIAGGIGVYYGKADPRNVSKTLIEVDCNDDCKSHRAELLAIKCALDNEAKLLKDGTSEGPINIHSDSLQSLLSMTFLREYWKVNGWRKLSGGRIKDMDLIVPMSRQLDSINQIYNDKWWGPVQFTKVPSHSNVSGNIYADCLAKQGADEMFSILYTD
ncbi:hypothetical protein DIURU_000594 [Diutina rugosa]|uniref:ribonuclease H n=1 Tax=Diutina rugosa TaxID=5481 RepID=A0A642UXL7_DIURU|nr:uncharacterized protein DIURU_000594 [Diutina rugosa]KAA8907274.1 hypothetical protein DIURU_000594 [Diutina rugosa]